MRGRVGICVLLASGLLGGQGVASVMRAADSDKAVPSTFSGSKAGDQREVVGIPLCWCPPGRFMMGSPGNEPERRPDEDQVEVALTKGFWMGKFEVTQGQWKRLLGKLPGEVTAELPAGDDFPVGNVNFAEAEAFCHKLTELGHQSGALPGDWEFRLPTEAQWEYACRAGTTTATSFGDKLSSRQANFKGKPYNGAEPGPSLNRAARVGSYAANAWGLHDMHGNTFEWCRDWYHRKLPGGRDPDLYSDKTSATKNRDGSVPRVRRGGCWADDGWPCRSAFRLRFEPERRYDHIGFRVVVVQTGRQETKMNGQERSFSPMRAHGRTGPEQEVSDRQGTNVNLTLRNPLAGEPSYRTRMRAALVSRSVIKELDQLPEVRFGELCTS